MKRRLLIVAAVLSAACFSGCKGMQTGYIRADAIDETVRAVNARHDSYVREDNTLDPAIRESHLRDTELLNALLDEVDDG